MEMGAPDTDPAPNATKPIWPCSKKIRNIGKRVKRLRKGAITELRRFYMAGLVGKNTAKSFGERRIAKGL